MKIPISVYFKFSYSGDFQDVNIDDQIDLFIHKTTNRIIKRFKKYLRRCVRYARKKKRSQNL